MAKFDYKIAKEEIAEINAIVETCPDSVKEKCFEMLFAVVFKTPATATKQLEAPTSEAEANPKKPEGENPADLLPKLPSFIRRVCSGYAPVWGVLQTPSV